jgi:hypothetical protein
MHIRKATEQAYEKYALTLRQELDRPVVPFNALTWQEQMAWENAVAHAVNLQLWETVT